ncbi:hypothetical protein TMatcc_008036 [Talaromyces marneffei ATCC 18224]|uniref:G-protein coupled receptors family 1 profile domain-containing protein n=1 Tax=Talaromyces marneffei (strain ATCC 18224 / CBS 334.59 / QM 7333) TaxID=441960 RepID=B6QE88_TALMQ|nr:uncharacterized protein EYB26_004939 [Talaromyces marneffei]EEA24933.1 conserved hypothetical protein [Talaromyces marneffei ATCC 18224]KAE8552594.1 hypothetical protein EYB25_003973 [Talaromyces marneffei]QGA17269.1 hypothetical protein EYB26_004939 [Talaromyces marneffei]
MGLITRELMAAVWDANNNSQDTHPIDDAQLLQRSSLITRKSLDVDPLSPAARSGLIAVSILALFSLLATFGLLSFITYRFIFWQKYYKRSLTSNQYIVLIYNLILADFVQSLSFVLCLHFVSEDAIKSGSTACVLQGLLVQAGDPGSGLFVLVIAAHTFLLVTSGKLVPHRWFAAGVVGMWVFLAILVIIPVASYGLGVFTPSGVWCWIDSAYEDYRLYTHYIWIFMAEFGTVVLYAIMFFQLRRQMAASSILAGSQMESLKRLRRVVSYMVIYPVAYVVLSLPLAAGRMMTAQGKTPSTTYFCVAGAMMTSSGFVDVLLYTLTRRNLIIYSEVSAHRGNYDNMGSQSQSKRKMSRLMSNSKGLATMTTTITSHVDDSVQGGKFRRGRVAPEHETIYSTDSQDNDNNNTSTENIVQKDVELAELGKVYQKTTIEVTSEPAPYHPRSARNSGPGEDGNNNNKNW